MTLHEKVLEIHQPIGLKVQTVLILKMLLRASVSRIGKILAQ